MRALLLIATAITFALSSVTFAGNATWNVNGGATNNWAVNGNWLPNDTYPNGMGEVANLTNDITLGTTVRVNALITVGILNIGDSSGTSGFTLSNTAGNSLTFDNSGALDAQINKNQGGDDIISANMTLTDRVVVTSTTPSSELLTFTGAIDGGGGMTFNTTDATAVSTGATSFTSSNLQLNTNATYTGSTVLASGTLVVNSSGTNAAPAISGTSQIRFEGGNLVVRNGAGAGQNNDRLADTADFVVNGGGIFVYRTPNTVGAVLSETVGDLVLEKGSYDFRVMSAVYADQSITVTHSDLVRSGAQNFSFANFSAFNTGSAVLGTGGNGTGLGYRLLFNNIGGSSATNSAYLGGWATYANYTGFAAYSTTNGVVQAAISNLANNSDDASSNFLMNSATLTLTAGNKSYNALAFRAAGGALDLGGNTVTLVGGGLTFGSQPAAASTHSLSNGTLQAGAGVGPDTLFVSVGHVADTNATITAVIQDNSGDALTFAKGGVGVLILDNAMTYTGNTYVESGRLTLGASGSLVNGNVTVRRNANFEMLSGSEIRFNIDGISSADQFVQETGGFFTLNGTMTLDFASALSGSWDLFNLTNGVADGFSAINLGGAFSGVLTESLGVWSGSSGGYDFTFTESTGVLVSVIPEPTTWALLATSLTTLVIFRRRRR